MVDDDVVVRAHELNVFKAALAWVDRIGPDSVVNAWADDEDFSLIHAVRAYRAATREDPVVTLLCDLQLDDGGGPM